MTDEQQVSNILARFFAAVDEREWGGARALMTEPFRLDYSSFGGGEPADLDPTDILDAWAELLPGFDATHHQIGNVEVQVRGDSAEVKCYGTATHVIGDRVWTVVGGYRVPLVKTSAGWALAGIEFRFKYQTGDTDLPVEARARVGASI